MGWRIWIDRGGTFTDVVGQRPDGSIVTLKLLSEDPRRYEDPVLEGIERLLEADGDALTTGTIDSIRIGTTVATNALLEGKGEPTILVTTQGFGDTLWIGTQARPKIFELDIQRPEPLYIDVIEADERLASDGSVLKPLVEARLESDLAAKLDSGVRSVAIVFVHAHLNPTHEQRAAEIAEKVGYDYITTSSTVNPVIRFVSRGQTTVADAYLTPKVRRYFDRLASGTSAPLFFMQSNGGLARGDRIRGKDVVYSGPAGGVVGMAKVGERENLVRLIGFDMGGTSTDVSVYDQAFERREETVVRDLSLRAPSLDVHSVAAGGGSIVWFDGMRLRVGDDSAGAHPGPTAYGRGGPLTVTDCQVLLGRLKPDLFPQVFGADGKSPLDVTSVRSKFKELVAQVSEETDVGRSIEQLALDFVEISVRKMAQAVRRLTVSRGLDPSDFALVAFGGAAPQHACAVADELGIRTILVPPAAGLLSALGIGLADVREVRQESVIRPCDAETIADLRSTLKGLVEEVTRSIVEQGVSPDAATTSRSVFAHYEGSESYIKLPFDDAASVIEAFQEGHRRRFGFVMLGREIMISSIEVEGAGSFREELRLPSADHEPADLKKREVWFKQGRIQTAFLNRSDLEGRTCNAPAVIVDPDTATVIEDGWSARLTSNGVIEMQRQDQAPRDRSWSVELDPMRLEIFGNLFMHIAQRMGDQLRRTARSVNVKERLDYSCALFDGRGNLVANAPHIPVHLGAMSETVKQVLSEIKPDLRPGDAFLVNDPFSGGTHVPDLTVVSPVFNHGSGDLVAVVASRAHHADIGGKSPGSMPADSSSVEEEGVIFEDMGIMRDGIFMEDAVRSRLTECRYPARNPDANIGDIQAQLAANRTGIEEWERAVDRYDLEVVLAYMGHLQRNAEKATETLLGSVRDGSFTVEMDSGQKIAVSIRIDANARKAIIDFDGTSEQRANNFNAPPAITTAAILYVLRCMAGGEMPLNSGCLAPIELRIPAGSMLDPTPPVAVAGGNVETSQCVVDALLGALGLQAGSQGTMNNVTFGDEAGQYYETICGGTGAGADFDGASAVHSHMTNSRITDPEILETRMPVLLEEFSIRRGSGGSGRHSGGNGVVRKFRFLKKATLSILSNRRKVAPHGLKGGQPGEKGLNTLHRANGQTVDLGPTAEVEIDDGDTLVVQTPGGGGYGSPLY